MAVTSGFFNSVSGDRKYSAEDIGRYLHGIVSSGVYADASSSLQVVAGGGMQVTVQAGRAMLDYHYMENDSPMTLDIPAAGAKDRIDAIVARLNMTDRLCEIAVKKGTEATEPTRPAMTRNDYTKEYMLASVYVTKLVTEIKKVNITDTRPDNTVCGFVTGVINQVDTTNLFTQYQEYMEAQKQAFDNWFAALTQEITMGTYIQEYQNLVVLEEDASAIPIGIADYVPTEDILFVNYRGLIYQQSDYNVTGTGASAVCNLVNDTRKAGDPIEFRVLKSKIGNAPGATSTTYVLTEGTNVLADNGEILTTQ